MPSPALSLETIGSNMDQPVPNLTKAQRDRALHAAAQHGNYHSYYTKFREQNVPDTRLLIVPSDILKGARVLDLGCNAGKLTAEVLEHFGASSAVGVDIDPFLIDQANSIYPSYPSLTFELVDFMDLPQAWTSSANLSTKFDVIMLLSVTKWIHLNQGDEKLRLLFKQIHDALAPEGHLVVEPQGWENYARAAKKNATLRPMYKAITLRPPFKQELQSVGFKQIIGVDRIEFGFERSVHVWKKI